MSKVSLTTVTPNKHQLRWREGGRHRQATVNNSKRQAERQRAAIEDRLTAGIADPGKLTLADLGRAYFEDGEARWTDKTFVGYKDQWERLILPELGGYRLDKLRRSQVRKWIATMERRKVGRSMQRKALSRLRSILRFGIEEELISINVAATVDMPAPPPKRPIVVTMPIDVERQRAAAIKVGRDRDALIYSLGFYLGLRPGELFGLTAGAVGEKLTIDRRRSLKLKSEFGKLKIGGQIEEGSKTLTIREVDLPELIRDELLAYIEVHDLEGDDLLFPNVHGQPLTDHDYGNWVRDRFNKHRANAKATPYSMRHSAATVMLHAHGAGRLAYIARQLGHSPTECLKTYQHVIDDLPEDLELIPVNKIISRARRQVRREHAKLRVA